MKTMLLVVAAALFAGCGATTPIPADRLTRAQQTITLAEAVPATSTDPKALQHLQLAKNQLEHARKLMVDGENEDAKWVLMRAESDAKAALYLANAQAAKTDAQQTIESIRHAMSTVPGGS